MTADSFEQLAREYVDTSPGNRVSAEKALTPELAGLRMYDSPIFGYAAADDECLLSMSDIPEANLIMDPPSFWLPGAKTVVSIFLPLSRPVRVSNRMDPSRPSREYMHARIDGQDFIISLCLHLKEALLEAGYDAAIPAADSRFWSAMDTPKNGRAYTSNWSERHVAYACGLGTFSLSRTLITRVGASGRLASLITDLKLPATPRPYHEPEEYCSRCGACAARCPANAITLAGGKDHALCSAFLSEVKAENAPYYGCGKCQTAVPCESRIPGSGLTHPGERGCGGI